MAKQYLVQFGSGNPAGTTMAGLTPTFIAFYSIPSGGSLGPPGITQLPNGAGGYSTGLFYFTYEPTTAIAFVIDGGSALSNPQRYVVGDLDATQTVDEKIGSITDSFGSTLTDPTTVFGYLKRLQEWNEGDSTFTKTSGSWAVWSRGNTYVLGASTYPGASTQLTVKTLTDSGSVITKI